MIHEIAPHRFSNHYEPNAVPAPSDYVAFIRNRSFFCKASMGSVIFPTYGELEDRSGKFIYLFSLDERSVFLAVHDDNSLTAAPAWENWDYYPVFSIRKLKPAELAFAALVACQLGEYYRCNRFCGCCGSLMVHSPVERAMTCPECHNTVYPKLCPVVIVAVRNGDKLLLTKYKGQSASPFYALIAGFAEIGETIEEAAAREVREETGVAVKNLHYYKCQPWPISDSLLFGFFCDLDGSDTITVEPSELSVAEWVPREAITNRDDGFSLTSEMIEYFRLNGHGDDAPRHSTVTCTP